MRCLGVVLAICASASASLAQPTPSDPATEPAPTDKQAAGDRFAEGQRHFDAGEYLDAANDFEAAYKLDPDPVYLYNTAQAYRHGSACARAADYYRRFLEVVPNPPNLEKVQHYLHDLDACAKIDAGEPRTSDTATSAPTPVAPAVIAHVDAPVTRSPRPLAISLAGAAVIATGAWFTHDVQTLEGYGRALCPTGTNCQWDATKQARAQDLQHRGDRATAISIGCYGVGGAGVIAGIALYMLGGDRGRQDRVTTIEHVTGGALVVTKLAF